ncbi:MAG: SPOR domain-containing protein [Candidatus Neomarinimicrobiota bacterium]
MIKLRTFVFAFVITVSCFSQVIQQEFLDPSKIRKNYKHKEFKQILYADDEVFKSDPTALNKEFIEMSGYRVQLVSTQNLAEAISVKNEADSLFSLPVYVDFEPPNYKVRIGNYLLNEEASDMQNTVLSRGFKSAWVVPSKIIIARSK